ncbi:MAG: hypothetical protein IT162_19695 [Bryobacterales bacterium]|nr:hypothetical protein [Bryobacterales bacterium]
MKRRTVLSAAAAASVAAAPSSSAATAGFWSITPERIAAHDKAVDTLLARQISDRTSRWHGGLLDGYGLPSPGGTVGILAYAVTGLVLPESRHRQSARVRERVQWVVDYLGRHLSADGNIDLLFTNFNSPPDSAFAMYSLAPAVAMARQYGNTELERLLEPVLKRMANGIARGGVHTPNHRWVMCAALAQAHALYPTPAWLKRIDDWLMETIDIDADGQYSERSTAVYNGIVDRALSTVALKLNRPALLEHVRRNLESTVYLLHPDYEVVTEVSTRQDRNVRMGLGNFWLPLRLLAVRDNNGVYETLARKVDAGIWELILHPELSGATGPEPKPVPDNYEKQFPALGVSRIRRGLTSATLMTGGGGASRLVTLRRGQAILNAVRFAGAFFGRGQFKPEAAAVRQADGAYLWTQSLEAGYYQPFGDGTKQPVGVDEWYRLRTRRQRTEVRTMRYDAELRETPAGFRLRVRAAGTREVPVAIELNLGGRDGRLEGGALPVAGLADAYVLGPEAEAVWRVGADTVRMGPGRAVEHQYVEIRGAEAKLPGPTVYITGFTPFDHTIDITWA